MREVESAEHDRPPPIGTLGNANTAVVVIALGVATIASAVSLGVGTPREPRAGFWPLIVGIVLTVLGAGLLDVGGLRFLGRESWRTSILTSGGVVAGFYPVFVAALAVPNTHLF